MGDDPKGPGVPRWRDDFPVRWDADHYMTRRELAKFLTLGSALLVAASGAVAIAGRVAKPEAFAPQPIADAETLTPGASLLFRYPTDDDPCILVCLPDGTLKAYSQVCTHLSCAVRHDPGSDSLVCPCHRGVFAAADGRPTAGPPTRPLPRIALARRDDQVYAVGVEV
ncbi:MAG TPA: Rieske 2Fe-2S domain-containing protein [Vicinamibacterales bacterium]|nr:Rieske 2Fe-2S domain-containing protein [Vicinamibacterales bacterium]